MTRKGILGHRLETHCTTCGRVTSNTPAYGRCPLCQGKTFTHWKLPWGTQLAHDTLPLFGRGVLTATIKGTRKYSDPICYSSPDERRRFIGSYITESGIIIAVIDFKNIVATVGKHQIGDMLIDVVGYDTGLTYCALGADDTTPVITDTQLVDEGGGGAMRKTITSKSRSGKEITLSTFFTAAQSTLAIEEAGIFGHSTAGAGENSGILFSRWLSSYDNSAPTADLTFDYVLTIG